MVTRNSGQPLMCGRFLPAGIGRGDHPRARIISGDGGGPTHRRLPRGADGTLPRLLPSDPKLVEDLEEPVMFVMIWCASSRDRGRGARCCQTARVFSMSSGAESAM